MAGQGAEEKVRARGQPFHGVGGFPLPGYPEWAFQIPGRALFAPGIGQATIPVGDPGGDGSHGEGKEQDPGGHKDDQAAEAHAMLLRIVLGDVVHGLAQH
jgi:hypothetical protein